MDSAVLPPSTVELDLLLKRPAGRTRAQWATIFGVSIVLHIVLFTAAVRVPSLIGSGARPEREVVVHHIPLYLPPEVMTQKAPNRQKVSKQIDLADLAESRPTQAAAGGRPASVRRFEMPKQMERREMAKSLPPQILPQAPAVSPAVTNAPQSGIPGGLPAPPQPAPASSNPFQNIGEPAPPNPHPKLAPPKASVNAAIDGLRQSQVGRELMISDDVPESGLPGSPGAADQGPAQHAAVELQSDANGADFKAYLRNILLIVRGNWRKVVPESARMGMLRGRTVVEFIIDRNGAIPKLVMADTSGSEPLDRAAVAGLSMSNPLPPLPADYKGFQVRLAFTFAYNMPAK